MVAILVTRPAGTADPLVDGLRSRGWRVHAVPTVATEPVDDPSGLDAALVRLGADDWLVLTSATGARVVAERLRIAERLGRAGLPRTAAVGPGTARAMVRAGMGQPIEATTANGVALADALLRQGPIRDRHILLCRASAAAPDLPDALRWAGADVEDLAVYRTVEGPPASRDALLDALADPEVRAIVLASGSAVRGLVRLAGANTDAVERLRELPVVTIGPRTTTAARGAGLKVVAEAASPSVDGMLAAVETIAVPAGTP